MLTPKDLYQAFGFYESERFVLVKDKYSIVTRCGHFAPLDLEPPGRIPEKSDYHITDVAMKPLAKDRHILSGEAPIFRMVILGTAGQCPVCGKVYYSHA